MRVGIQSIHIFVDSFSLPGFLSGASKRSHGKYEELEFLESCGPTGRFCGARAGVTILLSSLNFYKTTAPGSDGVAYWTGASSRSTDSTSPMWGRFYTKAELDWRPVHKEQSSCVPEPPSGNHHFPHPIPNECSIYPMRHVTFIIKANTEWR